tara:strand:+ start:593 stop:790 length:198 start_codon:yes stop_codon:yes gene_type:complete
MPAPFYMFREKKSLNKLRKEKKKDNKAKPFINKKNKILIPNRESVAKKIRESNRTKILMDLEFFP